MLRTRKIMVSVIILLLCFFVPLLSALIATAVSQATSQDEQVFQVPAIKLPEKGHPKLQSELWQLIEAENRGEASAFAQQAGIDLVDGKVRVIIEAASGKGKAATSAAESLGATAETSYANWVQVVVPISMLAALADSPGIDFVRLPRTPWLAVISEGLDLINVPEWHSAGFTGAGVKVAILDIGFSGYTARQSEGELPSSVTVQSFRSDGDITGGGEVHGTACAEIIYDIAPDADFYLVNFGTDVEWGNAVDWLIAQEIDVISSSIGWVNTGPGDGTGPICEKVAEARSAGILWSNAAGNQAHRHWQGDFLSTDGDRWHDFDPSSLDESNAIYAHSWELIVVALKWDDPWGASSNDYDLYLFNSYNPNPLTYSINRQNGDDDPVERIVYIAIFPGYYHIAINKYSATEAVNFHIYTYYHDLQYQVSSRSLLEPADSSSAMTMGAVYWNNPDIVEGFSSQGPTVDGRKKPDLVAYDGVSTAAYGAGAFYGTSASAPHAAGAAALVKERFPSYTPAEIQALLEARAVDLGIAGKDNLYGSGRLNLGAPNSPPSVASVAITPDPAYTYDTLVASPSGWNDDDGDPEGYQYQWQKWIGGVWQDIVGETSSSLEPSNFVKGDQIKVICTPYDGIDTGSPVEDTITISNVPPTAPVVDVTPNYPVTTDNLVCGIITASTDPDGDPITYSYAWYRDGELQSGLTTETVPASDTAAGETWRCVVTPNDGTVDGPSAYDEVTVYQSPDVNGDGRVNVLDTILVGQHYGETGPPCWIAEDVNCDGVINDLDMNIISELWTG